MAELIQCPNVGRNHFTTKSQVVEKSAGVGGRENRRKPKDDLYLLNEKYINCIINYNM